MSEINDPINVKPFYKEFYQTLYNPGWSWRKHAACSTVVNFLSEFGVPPRVGFPILKFYAKSWSYATLLRVVIEVGIHVTIALIEILSELYLEFTTSVGAFIKFGSEVFLLVRDQLGLKTNPERSKLNAITFNFLLLLARTAIPPPEHEFALGCMEERFQADRLKKGLLFALRRLVIDIFVAYRVRIKEFLIKQVSRITESIKI